jgi:hypothetical protein
MESSRRAFLKGAFASGFLWSVPSVWAGSTAHAATTPRGSPTVLCEEEAFPPIGPGTYAVGMCVRETDCSGFDPTQQLDALCRRKTQGKCQDHKDCPHGQVCTWYPKENQGVVYGQPSDPKLKPIQCVKPLIYCASVIEILEGGSVLCACICLPNDSRPQRRAGAR